MKYFFSLMFLFICVLGYSQDTGKILSNFLQGTKLSGQWFLANTYDQTNNIDQFELKRGYFTLQTDLSKNISVRYTQDITLDEEGSDMGNIEMRMKYLYLKLKINDYLFFAKNYFEFGLVHRPWIDFEEHINTYRLQEQMAVERYHLISSADFGVVFVSLLGGEMNEDYQHDVNHSYSGKYGSFMIGLYNGGGYHAIEHNNNKTIEARLSIRPFPSSIPGLQISYSGAYGKNNIIDYSDFSHNMFYISSESKYHVIAAQYFFGKGDFGNRYYDGDNLPYRNIGYSFFGEAIIPGTKFALFGRYDNFTVKENEDFKKNSIMGGLAYRFLKNKVVVDLNSLNNNGINHQVFEIVLEVKF